eukprot:scaffold83123_cov31-Tisochrysis_lutea.AAC.2
MTLQQCGRLHDEPTLIAGVDWPSVALRRRFVAQSLWGECSGAATWSALWVTQGDPGADGASSLSTERPRRVAASRPSPGRPA